jgi:FlaA1/EpsC-like NDP-sugar epimerase
VGIRFEGGVPAGEARLLWGSLPLLVLFRAVALESFGLHERPWRYVDLRDVRRVAGAILFSSVAFWFAVTAVFRVGAYSRSVLLLDAMFAVTFLAAGRLLSRMQHGLVEDYRHAQRALLVGSGGAIEKALARIGADRSRALEVAGIVEVDSARIGAARHGVPVLGAPRDLERLLAEHDPDLVLIESDSIAPETRRQVALAAARYEKPCSTVDAFARRVNGEERFATADLDAEVLLPREAMRADLDGLRERFAGRRVMVTGAGGAIGSELARTLASLDLEQLVLFERHEPSLERIDREVRGVQPVLSVLAVPGDVTEAAQVAATIGAIRPHVILHAAASTRAALVESHPDLAFRTNVVGARTVASAALAVGVERFLLISSDEAVEPRGPLAISRRGAEDVVRELHGEGDTIFAAIRFPVTLDDPRGELSRFRSELERGGPVRVASPEAMVLPLLTAEAAHLILEAADRVRGGEVILIDCGKPIRVLDLARAAVLETGLAPGRDVDIQCTGLAEGDRLSPRLCDEHEIVWRTSHPRLLMVGDVAQHAPARAGLPLATPVGLVGAEV